MEFTPVWIVTLCVYFFSVLAIVFLAKITQNPLDSRGFSFKRMFPCEVAYVGKNALPYRILLCVFVAASFAPIFNLFANSGQIDNIQGLTIAISCIFGLAAICFAFLNHFDPTHTMVHLILFVLFVCLTLLGNALAAIKGIAIYKVYSGHNQQMYVSLIGGILCGCVALVVVMLSLNPKLKNWPNLQRKDDGFERPSLFILAYTEWLVFFLLAIGELSYFLILLVQ